MPSITFWIDLWLLVAIWTKKVVILVEDHWNLTLILFTILHLVLSDRPCLFITSWDKPSISLVWHLWVVEIERWDCNLVKIVWDDLSLYCCVEFPLSHYILALHHLWFRTVGVTSIWIRFSVKVLDNIWILVQVPTTLGNEAVIQAQPLTSLVHAHLLYNLPKSICLYL